MRLPALPKRDIIPAGGWSVLAQRLRDIGLTPRLVSRIQDAGMGLTIGRQHALWRAEWRRETAPAARALRMLMLADPLREHEAIDTLTEPLFRAACSAGLLMVCDGGWFSPFTLNFMDDLFLFSDRTSHEPDAVMAVSPTTQLLSTASVPSSEAGQALDLGCGCGALAIRLARCARRVFASDVNSRAVELSEFNAALNGVENLSFASGDMFAPIAGESFDLIVCQPPFLARVDDAAEVAFLHGGSEGDEIAMRVLREGIPRLNPGGKLVMLNDWPMHSRENSLLPRIRAVATENECTAVVLLSDATDVSTHCASYATYTPGEPEDVLAARIQQYLDHFTARDIVSVRQAVCMIERCPAGGSFELPVPVARWINIRRPDLDSLLDALRFQSEGIARNLDRKVSPAPGTSFLCRWTDAPENGQLFAEPPGDSPFPPLALNQGAVELIRILSSCPDLGAGLKAIAERESVSPQTLHPHVQSALVAGLLRGIVKLSPALYHR